MGVGALVAAASLISIPAAAQAADGPSGCGYGEGGPRADQICWIDMSAHDRTQAEKAEGQQMSIDLPGGLDLSFTVHLVKGSESPASDTAPRAVTAAAFPTWTGTPIGNAIYKNTPGKPALWTTTDHRPDGSDWNGYTVKAELSDITVSKNGQSYDQYSFLVADAESTDGLHGTTDPEALRFTSDKALTQLFTAQPEGYIDACKGGLTGLGTTTVECSGLKGLAAMNAGDIVLQANAPKTITAEMKTIANSREAVAFAVSFTTVNGSVTVNQDGGSSAQFTTTATQGTTTIATATTSFATPTSEIGPNPILADTAGSPITYTVAKTSGDTPADAYDITWTCTANGVSVPASEITTSPDGRSVTVTAQANDSVRCDATATAKGPSTGPQSVTVGQGETATLSNLNTVPGKAAITEALFDNGSTTKVVAGEGTWTIGLKDGQPTAKFVPQAGFTGPVTQQDYTVTDANGLMAKSRLDVIITPITGDDSATINPGQTATLTPVTKAGSGHVTSAAFDNDQTTKVVPGEGTWTIELKDGQPVATFTPEDPSYTGTVTPQQYRVTDENGHTADGKLSVTINVPPQADPDAVTIDPGQSATLHPQTTPGNSPLASVAFDNGATTKHVDGEGTWKIELNDGAVVATFTPDDPSYHGTVTQQSYTVTDENGLTATSTLDVTITVPVPTTTIPGTTTPGTTIPTTPGAADQGSLASTGATALLPIAGIGVLALLAGAGVMLLARRNRHAE